MTASSACSATRPMRRCSAIGMSMRCWAAGRLGERPSARRGPGDLADRLASASSTAARAGRGGACCCAGSMARCCDRSAARPGRLAGPCPPCSTIQIDITREVEVAGELQAQRGAPAPPDGGQPAGDLDPRPRAPPVRQPGLCPHDGPTRRRDRAAQPLLAHVPPEDHQEVTREWLRTLTGEQACRSAGRAAGAPTAARSGST